MFKDKLEGKKYQREWGMKNRQRKAATLREWRHQHGTLARGSVELREKMATHRKKYGQEHRGANSPSAKIWKLRTPQGTVIEGISLTQIVLQHQHLFSERDLKFKTRSNCNATLALRSLFSGPRKSGPQKGKPAPLSWKGWMPLDKKERGL